MDSQENVLSQDNLEEAQSNEQTVVENSETPAKRIYTTKEEIVERAKEIEASDDVVSRDELDLLKNVFYKLLFAEREEKQKEYTEAGGDPASFVLEADPMEETFKATMALIREKRSAAFQKQENEKQDNLKRKLEIIEKVKEMATSPDEANKSYKEFKALQEEWKTIGAVPAEKSTETWRSYQHIVEQYYDLLKLNIEAREYDFKKNLDLKTKLCEAAERLAGEKDVVSAFHQLQELHNEYREIGPVAKELREEIWARFKAASTIINKAHQKHFEELRAGEEENLKKKTEFCEQAEAICDAPNEKNSDWEEHSKQIIALQAEWKTIGFAPQKMNVKIFERFRAACDKFFTAKAEHYKQMKEAFNENIAKKQTIIEKAKELAQSTEWRSTGDKLIALQKEWKTIGATPKKIGDQLWAEFRAECDKFFDARNAANSGTRNAEKDNLETKRGLIEKIKALAEEATEGLQEKIQALQEEYNNVGHVPFRDKDKLYQEYRSALDLVYGKVRAAGRSRRLEGFKAAISRRGDESADNERSRLLRTYDILKQEIITYENNLGFLSAASKQGNALVDEISRKIEKLKDELQFTRDKIKAIDENNKEHE